MENWKGVVGWEDLYEVSNLGRVKSKRNNRILKSSSVLGYRQVILCRNGKMTSGRVHRLVAIAFIQNHDNKPHINHIDGVRDNNRIENLEWVTASENVYHNYKNLGRIGKNGENHNWAKLTIKEVKEIRAKYIPRKYSYARLGKEYGVNGSTIGLIMSGRNWKYV